MSQRSVRWGLLSTARINERLIPVLRGSARSELLGVASSGGPEKAARYASEWNIPRAYGSYEALLADPEVDAVYISLPNALHRPWVVKTAEAGKHILCEKPLALTATDVDVMAEAARRNGVVLQEAVMMRYHPQTLHVQQRVAAGAIGEVRLIRGVFTFTLARPGDIRLDPALGGGSIWDVGSYPVNFMRTMLRANPVEVHGWQISGEGGAAPDQRGPDRERRHDPPQPALPQQGGRDLPGAHLPRWGEPFVGDVRGHLVPVRGRNPDLRERQRLPGRGRGHGCQHPGRGRAGRFPGG
jgi:predicted dehydrogenase